ncbi:hypothetical protein ABH310_11420 [Chromobacterium piscinae]
MAIALLQICSALSVWVLLQLGAAPAYLQRAQRLGAAAIGGGAGVASLVQPPFRVLQRCLGGFEGPAFLAGVAGQLAQQAAAAHQRDADDGDHDQHHQRRHHGEAAWAEKTGRGR